MDFLLYVGAAGQIFFIVAVFGVGSVAGLCFVRWLVPLDRLQKNHEVAGVTFGVLGAFYGLVLAFVIVAAWERFDMANSDAITEATALESLYKLGAAFSEPMRTQIDSAVLEYSHRVIDKSIDQLNLISQARSRRYNYYQQDLPSVVWTVIYLGCLMTIGFSYFFGSNVFRAQVLMCGFFSVLLGMTILAILELAHPYQGVVTITNEPYRYAISRMEEVGNYNLAAEKALHQSMSTASDR